MHHAPLLYSSYAHPARSLVILSAPRLKIQNEGSMCKRRLAKIKKKKRDNDKNALNVKTSKLFMTWKNWNNKNLCNSKKVKVSTK